ncbi:hypothetical protein N7466_004380 [Penicillium verhagenii]|uniref:uncharacterized protein n=1 Tax=Penicillium verhagenii TaxID=1562060 RepID=UPI00254586F4|nr:uncharacterized protein N7466_004380 [Penicillium verhagenii]KAJ5934833.1 hypothetical protein N7466_004380 [Penicillium verhagenii]
MPGQLTWLVTGCSSGLGEAFVQAILDKGDRVIATGRPNNAQTGANRLLALKYAGAATLEIDVLAPQKELDKKAKEAWAIYGQVDVLVNNAGFIQAGILEEYDEESMIHGMRVNAFGPLNLTRSFIPLMREAKTGTILFSGSLGVYYGAPAASCYSGSKGLIEGLVPNMAIELAPFGIRTCILTFGNFRTKIMSHDKMRQGAYHRLPVYEELNELVRLGLEAQDGTQPGDPKKACEIIVDAVRGEGLCAGKELPLRLPVGPDAFVAMRASCNERLAVCDEWEGITSNTNIE